MLILFAFETVYISTYSVLLTCRWGWSSWRDFCSGRPCWEVAGTWYRPKIAWRWPGYHLLNQCSISWWLPEKNAHIVAETELQCMYHKYILGSEILVCPLGSNFAWPPELELSIICRCMVPGWKGYSIGIHFSNRNSAVSFESLYRTMNLVFMYKDRLLTFTL